MKKLYILRLILPILFFFAMFPPIAHVADRIIGSDGNFQLVDNSNIRWNISPAYTTNGNGDVVTLGGLFASGDDIIGDALSGNRQLVDNAGKRWNLQVFYTTDGNGNVIPITGGGASGPYTPSTPANFPAPAPTTVQGGLDSIAATMALKNAKQVYVDASAGSDVTGIGSKMRPYQSIPIALAAIVTSGSGHYVLQLAPGNYSGAPIAWPNNVSVQGASETNTSIDHVLTYTAQAAAEEIIVFRNVGVTNQWTFDLTASTQTIIRLQQGNFKIKRVDSTSGAHLIQVYDSFLSNSDIVGNVIANNSFFTGGPTDIVRAGGLFGLFNCVVGVEVDIEATGTLLTSGSVVSGTIKGLAPGATFYTDSSSLALGGTLDSITPTYTDAAQRLGYAPTTPGNWPSVPDTVLAALDTLAIPTQYPNEKWIQAASGDDSTGDGSFQKPWKSLFHACATASTPVIFHISGGDASASPIVCPSNISIIGDAPGNQINQDITITASAGNDSVTLENLNMYGTFTWIKNDASSPQLTIFNTVINALTTFHQDGAGPAAFLYMNVGALVGLDIRANQASLFNVGIFGPITYADSGASAFLILGGDDIAASIALNGGISAYIYGALADAGYSIAGTTTGSGTPSINSDAGSLPVPGSITGAFTIAYTSWANYENYTPVLSANWSSPPATVNDALDKLVVLQQSAVGSQPACSSANRGLQWLVQGGVGVADIYQICQKDNADAYVWTTH